MEKFDGLSISPKKIKGLNMQKHDGHSLLVYYIQATGEHQWMREALKS